MVDALPPSEADETTERRWPDRDGPWLLRLQWARRKGRPEPVGITLFQEVGSGKTQAFLTLTTSLLREIKIAEIAAEEREKLPFEPPVIPTPDERVAGMRPQTVDKLKRVAAIYREAWQAGENPTKAVERRLNTSPASANSYVRRAREVGFLPSTEQGRPAG